MYYFIYDALSQAPENAKELARIENRLLDFGIKDKIVKISALKSVRDAVSEAYKHKYNTVITVGGDSLFLNTLSFLVGYPIALGTIPLGKNPLISKILGMPYGHLACDTISARKLNETTVGMVDNRFFFSTCVLRDVESITVDSMFELKISEGAVATIINHRTGADEFTSIPRKPGFLNIVVQRTQKGIFTQHKEKASLFFGKRLQINKRKGFSLSADNIPLPEECAVISIYPNAVKCIVGKTSTLG